MSSWCRLCCGMWGVSVNKKEVLQQCVDRQIQITNIHGNLEHLNKAFSYSVSSRVVGCSFDVSDSISTQEDNKLFSDKLWFIIADKFLLKSMARINSVDFLTDSLSCGAHHR